MPYTDVFSGSLINPSELTYRSVALSANTQLVWPLEGLGTTNVVARIMDVTPSAGSLSLTMPDARAATVGETILFNNLGASSYAVKDNAGADIVTVAGGQAWQIYIKTNATAAGTWGSFQYGASLAQANAAALAGTGLTSSANQLLPNHPATLFSSNYTSSASDRAKLFVWTAAAGSFTLPVPATVGNGWFVEIKNSGTAGLTITPSSGLIDDAVSKIMETNDSAIFVTDGLDWHTVGFGQNAVFVFDTVSIDVAGTGNYTLSGLELDRISYNFTGALTGARSIVVPATVQQYWVRNNTTGSFTLTVKVSGQPGTTVVQGGANILFCDGIDVRSASTAGISVPITIAQGGTGATTASVARANLGSGSTGDALFTSATPAAAYAVLGVAPAGVVDGGTF